MQLGNLDYAIFVTSATGLSAAAFNSATGSARNALVSAYFDSNQVLVSQGLYMYSEQVGLSYLTEAQVDPYHALATATPNLGEILTFEIQIGDAQSGFEFVQASAESHLLSVLGTAIAAADFSSLTLAQSDKVSLFATQIGVSTRTVLRADNATSAAVVFEIPVLA